MRLRAPLLGIACTIAAVCLGSAPAGAAGFLTSRFGADHGQPALSTPYAVYFNPAALGGMRGTHIIGDGILALRSITHTRTDGALSPSDPAYKADPKYKDANTGENSANNILASPYLGVTTDLGTSSFRLGAAAYVPFGGAIKWNQDSAWANDPYAKGAVDGPQRWSSISGRVMNLYNTLALAYRIESMRLSFGVSGSLIVSSAQALRARNADGSDDVLGPNGALVEGRSLLEVSGLGFTMGGGVHWEPLENRKLRIGLSYMAPANFGSEMRLKGTLEQQFGSTPSVAKQIEVDLLQKLPDVLRIGAAYRLSDTLELRGDAQWERWSLFERNCVVYRDAACDLGPNGEADASKVILGIPRGWKDALGVRAGAAYWPIKALEVFGSLGLGTSAIPKAHLDAASFDSTNLFGTLGARYQATSHLGIAGSFTHIQYFDVTVSDGQSFLYEHASPSKSPSGVGEYSARVSFLNVNVTYSF